MATYKTIQFRDEDLELIRALSELLKSGTGLDSMSDRLTVMYAVRKLKTELEAE